MKIQAGVLFASQEPLAILQAEKLPFKASYAVARAIRKFGEEIKAFDEKRIELIKKHGDEVKGGGYKVREAEMAEFTAAFNELATLEVTISDVEPIDSVLFGDVAVAPIVLAQLDWLLK